MLCLAQRGGLVVSGRSYCCLWVFYRWKMCKARSGFLARPPSLGNYSSVVYVVNLFELAAADWGEYTPHRVAKHAINFPRRVSALCVLLGPSFFVDPGKAVGGANDVPTVYLSPRDSTSGRSDDKRLREPSWCHGE